jgi:propanol-preferring alcohol dehydrogenase
MKAMVLRELTRLPDNPSPLEYSDLPRPVPEKGQVLIKVSVCGVCHTDQDIIEGRTPPATFPLVPGHQAVGRVAELGEEVSGLKEGDRVGVAWIHSACGTCLFCESGRENLCPSFRATGRDADGGYGEYMTVGERFAYPIPESITDGEAAPLLCAGAIGMRSLRLAGLRDGGSIGLVGFGASGHLVLKMVRHLHPRSPIYVFSRTEGERSFALELGAQWAGAVEDRPPEPLSCAIDTTPAWKPVVEALGKLAPGGRLVINAIRKERRDREALLELDYPRDLWMEKEVKSVANITRGDVKEFLALAAEASIRPDYREYPLSEANTALLELRNRQIRGAKVLKVGES